MYRRIFILAALSFLSLFISGCAIAGFAANVASGSDTIDAAYKGLPNQTCGVMVWADDGVINDFKSVQLDTANGIQLKLEQGDKAKAAEVANLTWVPAAKLLDYQHAHPESAGDAIEEIAPNLGVSRLIYIEVDQFQTHVNGAPDLWRGAMTATLKVIEITGNKGKVAFAERGIAVVAPKGCPPEGVPNQDDAVIYRATVDSFTSEVAKRFIPHPAESDDYGPPVTKE